MATPNFHINQRLSYDRAVCTVRYIGTVEGTKGEWLGVEWDDPLRGKHSGENNGKKYFDCIISGAGSFIRPTRTPDLALSFLEGLRKKYTISEKERVPQGAISLTTNKVVEEVGFDKIVAKLSQLKELKVVLLDGLCINRSDAVARIRKSCPRIEELDLSRNRFENLQDIANICSALSNLRSLRISGNRFSSLNIESPEPFQNITYLEVSNVLMSWDELAHLFTLFPAVHTIVTSYNNFRDMPRNPFPSTTIALDLTNNLFPNLSAITPLSDLPSLDHVNLSHNSITSLFIPPLATFPNLRRLELSYNAISAFPELDHIASPFPRLGNLRISHNPLYHGLKSDDAHMLTIARLNPKVHVLNHSAISVRERENAEIWYLSKIARELADDSEDARERILAQHRRWAELCELHGTPTVSAPTVAERKGLSSKLIELEFVIPEKTNITKRIPSSTPVSTLRALVAKWCAVKPISVKMKCERDGEAELILEVDDSRQIGMRIEGDGKVIIEFAN